MHMSSDNLLLAEKESSLQACNHRYNKTLGRARDPRANGAWLNKLTE